MEKFEADDNFFHNLLSCWPSVTSFTCLWK